MRSVTSSCGPLGLWSPCWVRARARICVHVKSMMTTGSMSTTTDSTTVEKGPLAWHSRRSAMVDEGDRAIPRQAMCSAAAILCAGESSAMKGMKTSPSKRQTATVPAYTTTTWPARMARAARIVSAISLMWRWPPAVRPRKPSAKELIHVSLGIRSRGTTLKPYGPTSSPYVMYAVIIGRLYGASSLPHACEPMQTITNAPNARNACWAHVNMQSCSQHLNMPSSEAQTYVPLPLRSERTT
mmetsp:Transcript_58762/g.161241  ORF Transcript_58762/g.161241 Transcript_58762/m.161241 type:complete len:241 (+) Transcript_58762:1598-2320(+)